MKRRYIFGIVATTVMSVVTAAHAADMPRPSPQPVYKAPAEQAYDWTGFYAGLNFGYAWGRSRWSDPAIGADSGRIRNQGGLVGGQLGYNWQSGPLVFGLETDLDWLNANGSTVNPGSVCDTDGGGTCQTRQTWLGTTRGRVGYAFDRWLPYLTGGVAYGNIQATQPTGTSSTTNAGWALGGGMEYALGRQWTAKVEYLHVDLGTATFMGAASGTNTLSVPMKDSIVRAGLNYRW